MSKVVKLFLLLLSVLVIVSSNILSAETKTKSKTIDVKKILEESSTISGGAAIDINTIDNITIEESQISPVKRGNYSVQELPGAAGLLFIDIVGDNDGFGYGNSFVPDGGFLPLTNDPIANWFFDNRSGSEVNDPRAVYTDAEPVKRTGSSWASRPNYDHFFNPAWFSSIDSGVFTIDMSGVQQFQGMCPGNPDARDTLKLDGVDIKSFYELNQSTWGSGLIRISLANTIINDGQLNVDIFQYITCGVAGDAFAIDYSTLEVYGTASAPTVPILISPAAGSTLATDLPAFSWSGNGFIYVFQISTEISFDSIHFEAFPVDTSFLMPQSLSPDAYFWRVSAFNISGDFSGYSNVFAFTIPTPPNADFIGSPLDGMAPLQVNFTDLSSGDIFSWLWDFGDSTFSESQNPTHIYNSPGNYSVSLTAIGATSSSSISKKDYIAVLPANNPPIWDSTPSQSILEDSVLNFNVSASDLDGDQLFLSTVLLPVGANFTDNGDGTGSFSWKPGFNQAASYSLGFFASDGSLVDTQTVNVTVINNDRPPDIDSIGPKSVTVGNNLNFSVYGFDPDYEVIFLFHSALPGNATFTVDSSLSPGVGGTFDWNPTLSDVGVDTVTFYLLNGAFRSEAAEGSDSEVVVITVLTANNPPILSAIGNKSVSENMNLNFTVSATDPDKDSIILTVPALPAGATFVDNGNGTGIFDWTPSFDQGGEVHNVTFMATDGSLTVSEVVAITVTNVNRPPVLDSIGTKTTFENLELFFEVTGSDPDNNILSLTTSVLPEGASFYDKGTGYFSWVPTFDQSGGYNITFYLTDDSMAVDSEVVTIIVNDVNRPPVFNLYEPRSVEEGENIQLLISAVDPDETITTYSTAALPAGASFSDTQIGFAFFDWIPDFTQAGKYDITFYASDGELEDTMVVTITVNNVNQAPVLDQIGNQSVNESENLGFIVSATDEDDESLSYSTSPLPDGAIFSLEEGFWIFSWTPSFDQAGIYSVTFYVKDVSLAVDSEVIEIIVFNINQPPVMDSIGTQFVNEQESLLIVITSFDPDGDQLFYSLGASLVPGSQFTARNDSAFFTWVPTYSQAGTYEMIFIVADFFLGDTETVTIIVNNVNQPPILDHEPGDGAILFEGVYFEDSISAIDPDGTIPILSIVPVPPGATFTDNKNGWGTFIWTPGFDQAGTYPVMIYATDGESTDSGLVTIEVTNVNRPPVLDFVGDQSVNEGEYLSFQTSASDPDKDFLSYFVGSELPLGATFVDSGIGFFEWTPTFLQEGDYDLFFYVSDGILDDFELVTIIVNNVNQPPVLDSIGPKFVVEDSNLFFTFSADDPDTPFPSFSAANLPSGAVFQDDTKGTASFDWTPHFLNSGRYNVIFYVTDGESIDSEVVVITVIDNNEPPILDSIGLQAVNEGSNLNFIITAADPEGNVVGFTTSALPAGATLTDNDDDTGEFDWTPDFSQAGEYQITFYASDGSLVDSEVVTITVGNVNQPPVLDSIGNKTVVEGQSLFFTVDATDEDNNPISFSTFNLPPTAEFYQGKGNYIFDWTPAIGDAGTYEVTFYASDGIDTDSELVTIEVVPLGNITTNFTSINFVVGEFAQSSDTILLSLIFDGGDLLPVIINTSSTWLMIDNFEPELPADLNVFADPTSLNPGAYLDTIYVTGSATNSPLIIPVSLTINNDTLSVIAPTISIGPNPPYSDILITQPDISIFFSEAVQSGTIPDNLIIISTRNGFIDWFYDANNMSLVLLVEGGLFEPIDTITVTLGTGITDLLGQPIDRSYTLTFYTGPVVYPGDCDNNGIVDERDILPLGLFWNDFGPPREPDEAPLTFEPIPAHFGTGEIDWTPFRAVYADADGSGQVDEDDICGVASNYGMSNAAFTKLSQTESDNFQKALKLLDASVLEAMYNAIIECPQSQGQSMLKDILEEQLRNQSVAVLPDEITLYQNYPNPFNPSTTIRFFLPKQATVSLNVYSVTGRKVKTLIDNESRIGLNSVVWDGKDEFGKSVATGIYLYSLKTSNMQINKSMLLIK